LAVQARKYGSVRSQLTQVYVQKSTFSEGIDPGAGGAG
jgi:hypothetical protein